MNTNKENLIEISPEEIATNFFHDRDIKFVEDKIEDLKQYLLSMVHNNDRLQHKFNEIWDEKWKDNQLQEMKQELEETKQKMRRGFPIDEADNKKINQWILKYDEDVHNNPNHYHGVSGGGYEYTFHPTGLGTIGYCICENCKRRAIKEKGEKYWDYLKEHNSYVEFGDFG